MLPVRMKGADAAAAAGILREDSASPNVLPPRLGMRTTHLCGTVERYTEDVPAVVAYADEVQ
jgi:hypothetical protein